MQLDWATAGPYLLGALLALVGVLLLVGLSVWRTLRRAAQPSVDVTKVVLSYDRHWEQGVAADVRRFLEQRYGKGSVYSHAFDTETPAGLEAKFSRLIAQAPSLVALACEHFVGSDFARTHLGNHRGSKLPATVLVLEKGAHEGLQGPDVAAHFREAIAAKRYGLLFDERGEVKTGGALQSELERLFRPDPAKETGLPATANGQGHRDPAKDNDPPLNSAAARADDTLGACDHDYFISYNHATDAPEDSLARASPGIAEEVYAHLQKYVEKPEKIFYDVKMPLGTNIEQLPQVAARSRNFIPLVSKLYFSRNTVKEIAAFLEAKERYPDRRLIPIFLEPEDAALEKAAGLSARLREVLFLRVYADNDGSILRSDQLRGRIAQEFARGGPSSDLLEPQFHVPPQDASFLGRGKEIGKIAEFLQLRPVDVPQGGFAPPVAGQSRQQCRVQIVAGPGYGKTTLATNFAHKARGQFLGVWWLGAENRATLLANIQKLAGSLDASGAQASETEAIALIQRRFRERRFPYLLVFDNVQGETEKLVADLCGALSENVRVLITARSVQNGLTANAIELENLDLDDAAELLVRLATTPSNKPDAKSARDLARTLGCLPLALRNAGGVCKIRSFATYLKSLDERSRRSRSKDPVYITLSEALNSVERKIAESSGNAGHVRDVVGLLSYCAAERIPESLLDTCFPHSTDDTTEVLQALFEFGLIKAGNFEGGGDEKWYSIHRLNQRFIRDDVDEERRGGEIIARLMPSLCKLLLINDAKIEELDVQGADKRRAFNTYFPHFLAALPHLDAPEFRGAEDGAPLDEVAKLVMLKLREDAKAGLNLAERDESWDALPALLGCFYEVDPFEHVLDYLVGELSKNRGAWRKFRDGCLAQNNYVLRFALAEALARAVENEQLPLQEVTRLLEQAQSLNEFELGGYAFKALASNDPSLAHQHRDLLKRLAAHECYPGRSILGDLMLNLVYQGETPSQLLPPQDGPAFWSPIWDFVAFDVYAVRAAEFARGVAQPEMSGRAREQFLAECAYLERYRRWKEEAVAAVRGFPKLSEVVADVEAIGKQTDAIANAQAEFRTLAEQGAHEPVVKLLFGHPLWSVAERMANVISDLHGEANGPGKTFYRGIVRRMFEEQDWRVRYGAIEAAFQIRQGESPRNATFFEAVERFHADDSSKIRGLCAENLLSILLNQSDKRREELERDEEFGTEIARWMADDDCWVLEHVYRYFRALHQRAAKDESAKRSLERAGSATSPLLQGLGPWWELDRESFLKKIEEAKRSLLAEQQREDQ